MPLRSTFATKRMITAIAALTCVLFSAPTIVDGQVLYGSIVGNVNDPSLAPVPGALVTITN